MTTANGIDKRFSIDDERQAMASAIRKALKDSHDLHEKQLHQMNQRWEERTKLLELSLAKAENAAKPDLYVNQVAIDSDPIVKAFHQPIKQFFDRMAEDRVHDAKAHAATLEVIKALADSVSSMPVPLVQQPDLPAPTVNVDLGNLAPMLMDLSSTMEQLSGMVETIQKSHGMVSDGLNQIASAMVLVADSMDRSTKASEMLVKQLKEQAQNKPNSLKVKHSDGTVSEIVRE